MTEHEASRTLVKSPPELWAELSDESSLGRHFDQFGEIRITRLEPETAVAWEGERVSGTVRLEPSGWGTKVILTARAERAVEARAPEPAVGAVDEETPEAVDEETPEAVEEETPEAVGEPEAGAPPATLALEAAPHPEPLPPGASTAAPPAGRAMQGFFARLVGFLGGPRPEPVAMVEPPVVAVEPPVVAVEPPVVAVEPPVVTVEPPVGHPIDAAGVLAAALDSLGQAHHRPFSRG